MNTLYIPRAAEKDIVRLLLTFPAVAIVGPRQVGKTSLAKHIASQWTRPTVYLDLENPRDLNKLSDPFLFLEPLREQTVILDEIQRAPDLFPILRGLIDQYRVPNRFILLGSASPELIRDTSETLAGRIAYFELPPLSFAETGAFVTFQNHWLRGGFPGSLLAVDESASLDWRDAFIQTYLERDLPTLGLNANPLLTRRLWTMLAHWNGNLLNLETIGNSLGVSGPTVRRYIDFFEASYLIRRLQPWSVNISKRLVKSPKIFIRDTGVLHSLLAVGSLDDLQGRPFLGASWEACVVQEIATILPPRHELYFYRTQDGAEADLLVVKGGVPDMAIEIKYSSAPAVTKSLRVAAADLKTRRNVIVVPGADSYPLRDGFEVVGFASLYKLFEQAL